VALAERAAGVTGRPHPHRALNLLGSAEEDFGWLLQDESRYPHALRAFNEAVRAAEEAFGSLLEPLVHRARCRFKLVDAGVSDSCLDRETLAKAEEVCGEDLSDQQQLDAAIADLNLAMNEAARGATEFDKSEALYWLARTHAWRAMAASDPQAAGADWEKAEEHLRGCLEIRKALGQDWAVYQRDFARLALDQGRFDDAAARLREVLDSTADYVQPEDKSLAATLLAQVYLAQDRIQEAFDVCQARLAAVPQRSLAETDVLLAASSLISRRRPPALPWLENKDYGRQCAEAVLELAAQGRPSVAADAHAALAMHSWRATFDEPGKTRAERLLFLTQAIESLEKSLQLDAQSHASVDRRWWMANACFTVYLRYQDIVEPEERRRFLEQARDRLQEAVALMPPRARKARFGDKQIGQQGESYFNLRQQIDQKLRDEGLAQSPPLPEGY
jgi:hypothetical protein